MNSTARRRTGGWYGRRSVALAAIIAALMLGAGTARAQVRGTVSSTAGRPLNTVLVELLRGDMPVASRVTDSTGRFLFTEVESKSATALSARRIGFGARRVLLARRDTVLDVRLSGNVDVATSEMLSRIATACPNQEQPEARSLWQLVRRRYRSADSVDLSTGFSVSNTVVGGEDLGIPGNLAEAKGKRALPGTSRVAWRQRIAQEGYAWMLEYRGDGYASKVWEYPPLESDFAQHFTDHVFGRMHRLSLETSNDGEMVIAFCGANSDLPLLSGILVLAADSSLARGVWKVRSPEPSEEAGGDVIFTPYVRGSRLPILLPRRGLFWRRLPHGEYHQRWQYYERWVIDERDVSLADQN